MKVHYTGKPARFSETQERKLNVKLSKCHKILGKKHNLEAHVKFSRQRHLAWGKQGSTAIGRAGSDAMCPLSA